MADGSTLGWAPSISPLSCRLPPLCRAPPHLRSIRRAYLPDDSVFCVPSIMAKADTLSLGASHAGINPWSTVSLGQVIYTQGHVRPYIRSSLLQTHRGMLKHICHATAPGKLWKPVTVLTRAVMGVLFKVQRNLVKVWWRSLLEEMQSPREWVLAVLLFSAPHHSRGGGAVWISQTHLYSRI